MIPLRTVLELNAPEEAISIKKILPGFKLGEHGGDHKSREAKNQDSPTTLKLSRGTAYWLDRDRKDLAAKVRAFAFWY